MADTPKVPGIFEILTNIAASRNWVSGATGGLMVFVLLGVLDKDSVQIIVDGMQQIMDGFGTIVGGFKKIYLALPAGLLLFIATWAGKSSTLGGVLAWLGQQKQKDQGIVVVAPPAIANSVPAATVMSSDKATVVATPEVAQVIAITAPSAPVVSSTDAAAHPQLLQK